jgi:hypothetical protein
MGELRARGIFVELVGTRLRYLIDRRSQASVAEKLDRLEDLREAFEERAAIMEYDGGLPRAEAERLALAAILNAGEGEHA